MDVFNQFVELIGKKVMDTLLIAACSLLIANLLHRIYQQHLLQKEIKQTPDSFAIRLLVKLIELLPFSCYSSKVFPLGDRFIIEVEQKQSQPSNKKANESTVFRQITELKHELMKRDDKIKHLHRQLQQTEQHTYDMLYFQNAKRALNIANQQITQLNLQMDEKDLRIQQLEKQCLDLFAQHREKSSGQFTPQFTAEQLLAVDSDSDTHMIMDHYRKLSLIYHPDRGGDGSVMQALNQAKEQLAARQTAHSRAAH